MLQPFIRIIASRTWDDGSVSNGLSPFNIVGIGWDMPQKHMSINDKTDDI